MDLRDAAALLEISEREVLVREVESRIGGVRPDVRGACRELLEGST